MAAQPIHTEGYIRIMDDGTVEQFNGKDWYQTAESSATNLAMQIMTRLWKEEKEKTGIQMGVGNGDGNLFVYGNSESISRAQAMLLELGSIRTDLLIGSNEYAKVMKEHCEHHRKNGALIDAAHYEGRGEGALEFAKSFLASKSRL